MSKSETTIFTKEWCLRMAELEGDSPVSAGLLAADPWTLGVPMYFIARHPDLYRPGKAALIVDIRTVNGRSCFHLRYADGVEDDTPIVNEDFTGRGGLGYFYDIVPEEDVTNGH